MPEVPVIGPTRYSELAVSSTVVVTFASTHCAYSRRDGQAELVSVAGQISTCPWTVTHLDTNPVRRKVTSLTPADADPQNFFVGCSDWQRVCWTCTQCGQTRILFIFI